MAFDFILTFTGLCAFVPNTSGKQMRTLLLDRRHSHGTDGHEDHFPAIVFDIDSLPEKQLANDRQPDLRFTEGATPRGVCFLNREDLVVTPQSGDLKYVMQEVQGCAPGDEADLSWVAAMPRIGESSSHVDRSCLAGDKVHKMIGARLALTSGTVMTSSIATQPGGLQLLWKFRRSLPPFPILPLPLRRQALAEQVRWTLHIGADKVTEVTLSSKKFKPPGGDGPVLRLHPHKGSVVNADIRVLPLPDILRLREENPPPREKESHFEHFYLVSANHLTTRLRPIPFPTDPCQQPGISASNPKCPPAMFAEHPEA